MADPTYRTTLTIPADQAVLLNNLSRRIGCSQSAVVSVLLELVLPHLAFGLGDDAALDRPLRRLRGESGNEIRELIFDALRGVVAVHQQMGLSL
jgi:hypothetical protein